MEQMEGDMEKLRPTFDGIRAQIQDLKARLQELEARSQDQKEFLDYEVKCRLRVFTKQTTKDLIAYIESHHELRAEACSSGQQSHVAETILPVHLEKLGIPQKYWTTIEQTKEAKESPYIQVGNKLRQRYKFEKRKRPYDESPRKFAHLLRSDRFRETDVYKYWAPLFPMLYKKTVEEFEQAYILSLSSWKIRYPPL